MQVKSKTVKGIFKKPQRLNIIEEYAVLSPQRKFHLCDQYFLQDENSFRNAVKTIWPRANDNDARKLGNFLILLKSASH